MGLTVLPGELLLVCWWLTAGFLLLLKHVSMPCSMGIAPKFEPAPLDTGCCSDVREWAFSDADFHKIFSVQGLKCANMAHVNRGICKKGRESL